MNLPRQPPPPEGYSANRSVPETIRQMLLGFEAGQLVWRHVIKGIDQRDRLGAAEYGESLQFYNGREPAQDLWEEALDCLQYAVQFSRTHPSFLANAVEIETLRFVERLVILFQHMEEIEARQQMQTKQQEDGLELASRNSQEVIEHAERRAHEFVDSRYSDREHYEALFGPDEVPIER
jgi:hypothetical protein